MRELDVEAIQPMVAGRLAAGAESRPHSYHRAGRAHGAAAVLVDRDNQVIAAPRLRRPVLRASERRISSAARCLPEHFSPDLPLGLNLGRQLFFLQEAQPELFSRAAHALLYPPVLGLATEWRDGERSHVARLSLGSLATSEQSLSWRVHVAGTSCSLRLASDVLDQQAWRCTACARHQHLLRERRRHRRSARRLPGSLPRVGIHPGRAGHRPAAAPSASGRALRAPHRSGPAGTATSRFDHVETSW